MTPLKQQNITDTIFDSDDENRSDQTFCILLIKDVLSVIESANDRRRQILERKWSGFEFGFSY